MIRYCDAGGEGSQLHVFTDDRTPSAVCIRSVESDCLPPECVQLDRDSVAALIGQLSEWLGRTRKDGPR